MAHQSLTIGLFSFLGSIVLAGAGSAQARAPRELAARDAARPSVHIVFDGFVLAPDGSPAEGAVVTSSAGGRAIADRSGRYRLEAEVPLDARFVEVTATGRADANLSASTRFELGFAAGVVGVDPLQLVPDTCQLGWVPTFRDQPGVGGTVYALVGFDDGNGPALHAGGRFTTAGSVELNHIARWNGERWKALGSGLDGDVLALAVFDDGTGPALYAGGYFTSAGGSDASHVAKWDGASWSALGSGTDAIVQALVAYDDGSGPALYAGGQFTTAGGFTARRIARWDGASWSGLGSGTDQGVTALVVYDDGTGPALHAGGFFSTAGGAPANRIAKWSGASWSALGAGMNNSVHALTTHGGGSGTALVAGGSFTTAGAAPASWVGRWDGSAWSAIGGVTNRLNGAVRAQTVHDDGSEPALYAGGEFTLGGGVARWDGASWSVLGLGIGGGLSAKVHALAEWDDGGGPALYAGGDFTALGGVSANNIARWDGSSWTTLGSGLGSGLELGARALAVFDDGSGPALYAGGGFSTAGGVAVDHIARWDGSSWTALGSGLSGPSVYSLLGQDAGRIRGLYAGGAFVAPDSGDSYMAKWGCVPVTSTSKVRRR